MTKAPIAWLLEGEPWIAYRTKLDLLDKQDQDFDAKFPRIVFQSNQLIQTLIRELADWPGVVISSHKSAGQPFHKLTFLADLGLTADDPGISTIVSRILDHKSPEGPFQLPTNIPMHFGGTGQDQWAWALCDAPLIVYALIKFGYGDNISVTKAVNFLLGLVRENGWPCTVSKELGSFRGPGRKDDPCPFATLAMLKMLSEIESLKDSRACQIGAETLLSLWADSMERHPYMFYMGTDFRKLKVPFVWYDLMHVLEVLSRFPWLHGDSRFLDMLQILKDKANQDATFTLESIWTAWKEWEFGQKKTPSRWLTLSAWRIIGRVQNQSL